MYHVMLLVLLVAVVVVVVVVVASYVCGKVQAVLSVPSVAVPAL